jgi:hypothetical protein
MKSFLLPALMNAIVFVLVVTCYTLAIKYAKRAAFLRGALWAKKNPGSNCPPIPGIDAFLEIPIERLLDEAEKEKR